MKSFPFKYRLLVFLSVFTVVFDQLTKLLVLQRFHLGESVALIPGLFNLTYVRNTGAAFGILADAAPMFRIPFFTIVPLVALAAIGYVFRKIPDTNIKLSTALSLVIGGAIGNLIDRALWGYVVDFLDFHWKSLYHFPAFNVADSAICVGVSILMLDIFAREETREETKETNLNVSSSI